MKNPSPTLPEDLLPYESQIKGSVKSFIRITAQSNAETGLLQSKFGGQPYWPKAQDYPKDENGNPLHLLAQINWAEVSSIADFPEKGLLQFYVADDDMYGLNLDNLADQSNFRVVYFAEYNESTALTDFSFLDTPKDFPLTQAFALGFEEKKAPVAPEDIAFEQVFESSPYEFFGQFDEAVKKAYMALAAPQGHKIGGYAHFTQEDPRFWEAVYEEYQLLLQIDSEGENINWGDRGIANFFIKPDDLQALDFTKVLYHWDSP